MKLIFFPREYLEKPLPGAGVGRGDALQWYPAWWMAAILVFVVLWYGIAKQDPVGVINPPFNGSLLSPTLTFEQNIGQSDSAVRYVARGPGYGLYLTASGSTLVSRAHPESPLRMRLVGADPLAPAQGIAKLAAEHHYFIGNDPAQWRPHVPTYAQVRYQAVYPGIDLLYYGREGQLEYDFLVAPGADPDVIRLDFDGAQQAVIDDQGNLRLTTAAGIVVHHAPRVYQDTPQGRRAIAAHYQLQRRGEAQRVEVRFKLAAYDASLPLIIDPSLTYASFLGGIGSDEGRAVTVDGSGNFYVTGMTKSPSFPGDNGVYTPHVNPTLVSASDAFVSKFDKNGSLLFSVYLGGGGTYGDAGNAIAVDTAGKIYLTGSTDNGGTTGFPTTSGAYSHAKGGTGEVFITILKADGSGLDYSGLIGSGYGDSGEGIAVDSAGDIYVTGWTVYDTVPYDFPLTPGAYQTSYGGGTGDYDAFILKLHPAAGGDSDLVYATLLGGSAFDKAYGIAVDSSGRAYVTGQTASTLTTVNPLSGGASLTGSQDAFVARLSADGASMDYLTYLGGDGSDSGRSIVLDGSLNIYVAGQTTSSDVFSGTLSGASDAFAAKLSGTTLAYATRLGGDGDDAARALAVDGSGLAYVAGWTTSSNFPTSTTLTGHQGLAGPDAFVAQLAADGSRTASDYLGGDGADGARGIAVDAAGKNIYVTGWTNSTSGFPYTQNAAQTANAGGTISDCGESLNYGGCDAFIARFGPFADLSLTLSDDEPITLSGGSAPLTYTVTVTNNGPDTANNVTLTDTLPATTDVSYVSDDGGCTLSGVTLTCNLGSLAASAVATVNINVSVLTTNLLSNSATVSADEFDYPTTDNTASEPTQADSAGVSGTSSSGSGGSSTTPTPFITITSPLPTTTTSGGGGGAVGWPALVCLLISYGLRRRR